MQPPPFDALRLCQRPACFFFTAAPGWTWNSRVDDYYNLWIGCSGRGRLHSSGRSVELTAGSLCLFTPGQVVELEHDRLQPMSNFSAHFRCPGHRLETVLGLSMRQVHRIQGLAMAMVEAHDVDDELGQRQVRHLLDALLCQVAIEGRGSARPRPHARAVADIASRLRLQPERDWRIEGLADELGLSRSQLNRLFRRDLGCSPMQFLTRCRMDRATHLLRESDLPVQAVAEACGYRDLFYFSRHFKLRCGHTPSAFREGAHGGL